MHWLVLLFLIILATIGIGIGGAAPVQPASKKEDKPEIRNELVESKHDLTGSEQFVKKQ